MALNGSAQAPLIVEPCLGPQQQAVCEAIHPRCAILVQGGPGSGKTTALVGAVAHAVASGNDLGQIVVLTGSRAQAKRLRQRIVHAIGTSQRNLHVTTVHGWCQTIFQAYGGDFNTVLTAPEQEHRVRQLLDAQDRQLWPRDMREALGTRNFLRQIRHVVARARQCGLKGTDLQAEASCIGSEEWGSAGRFLCQYEALLAQDNAVDYAGLVFQTQRLIANRPEIVGKLRLIVCDEYAEFDYGMQSLVAEIHRHGVGVVAFADSTTQVFGFRGADPDALRRFREQFGSDEIPVRELFLTENYRCVAGVKAVLEAVSAKLAHTMPPGSPTSIDPHHSCVRGVICDNPSLQAEWIASTLTSIHHNYQVPWEQMCVITPGGIQQVAELSEALSYAGLAVNSEGDQLALGKEQAVNYLLGFLKAALVLCQGETIDPLRAHSLLRSPLIGIDSLEIRQIERDLAARCRMRTGHSVSEKRSGQVLLARELACLDLIDSESDKDDRILGAVIAAQKLVESVVRQIDQGADASSLLWTIWSATDWPVRLEASALSSGDESLSANRAIDAVIALFDLADRITALTGINAVVELLEQIDDQQIPADTARQSGLVKPGVTVTSIYRTKGQEWDTVVLVGLEEGSWPNLAPDYSLLSAEQLRAEGLGMVRDHAERLADQRRHLLLGLSRARQRVIATGVAHDHAGPVIPSRFFHDMGVTAQAATPPSTPVRIQTLVSTLRRIGLDPSGQLAERTQCHRILGWIADQKDRDGNLLYPGAHPDQWWDLRTHTFTPVTRNAAGRIQVRLSPSAVESLTICPRRWFLTTRAHDPHRSTYQQEVGTFVHWVAEHSVTEGITCEQALERLDTVWEQISVPAAWQRYSEKERTAAMVTNYYRWNQLPDHREVVGVEQRFSMDLKFDQVDVTLTGKIDRLERDHNDKTCIVDFKTGKARKADDNIQLGIYQLAYRRAALNGVDNSSPLGPAQLVFLREDTKHTWFQASLDEAPFLSTDDTEQHSADTWVEETIGELTEYFLSNTYPAIPGDHCAWCPFSGNCPATQTGGQW